MKSKADDYGAAEAEERIGLTTFDDLGDDDEAIVVPDRAVRRRAGFAAVAVCLWAGLVSVLARKLTVSKKGVESLGESSTRPLSPAASRRTAPNVFLITVDDAGWNDVGYQSTDPAFSVVTPRMTEYALGGVRLTQYYGQP